MKILIIEDDFTALSILKVKLIKILGEGTEVYRAESFEEGVKVAQEIKPDAISIDLWLPDSDYNETMERLPELTKFAPVVAVSCCLHEDSIRRLCLNNGAFAAMNKDELTFSSYAAVLESAAKSKVNSLLLD